MTPTVADALAVMRGLFIPCQQGAYDPGTAPQNASISMPYAVLVPDEARALNTGDGIAHEYRHYDIQLYTRRRDVALERRVAAALREAGIRTPQPDVALPSAEVPAAIAYFHISLSEETPA
jgi:hypothetical protein